MTPSAAAMTRRTLLATGGSAALVAFLAACADGAASSTDAVQLWSAFNNKEGQNWITKNQIDAFNAKHPDAQIKLSVKQIDTIDRLVQTALAAGSAPDVLGTAGPAQVYAYKKAGYLQPLDRYAEQFGWKDSVLPWALQTGVIDEKLYSIPTSYESMLAFTNPATFDEYGWTYPKNRDDFEAICEEAKGRGLMPVAAGNSDFQAASEWHMTIAFNHYSGPEAIRQALSGEIPFTDPVFVDAVSLYNDWFQKGWFGGSVDSYFTNGFTSLYQKLASGKAVFDFVGSWGFSEIAPFFGSAAGNDAKYDWGPLFPLRDGVPQEVWELAVGGTLSVNAGSKVKGKAAEYLDFLLSDPKRQGRAVAEAGLEPAPIQVAASDFPASTDPRLARFYETISAAKTVGYTTWTFWPQKSDTFIAQSFDKVITKDLTPKEYCTQLDEIFQKERKAGAVPPLPAV